MKFITGLSFVLFFSFGLAQFQRGYEKAEIHFKSGEILTGYIFDDFAQNDWYGRSDFKKGTGISAVESFNSPYIVSTFQTVINTIHFKQNKDDGQQTDYDSRDIDYIIVDRNGESEKYITTHIMWAHFQKEEPIEFDTLTRNIWLPVKTEGKISMYGYYSWTVSKNNGWAEVYFRNNTSQYAINPIQSHKFTLGLKPQKSIIKASLLKVFSDCPKFKDNIDLIIDEFIDDFYDARDLPKDQKQYIKSQPKEMRDRTEYEIRSGRSFIPYQNILKKYYLYCQKE